MTKNLAWKATIVAILAGIAIAITQNKVVPVIAVLQQDLLLNSSQAGWLSSSFCAVGIVLEIPAGYLVKSIGEKKAIIFSLCTAFWGTMIGAFSNNYSTLIISRIIEGIGYSCVLVAIPALITRSFPEDKRGFPMGLWSSCQVVAQSLCFFFELEVCSLLGWRGVWCAASIIIIVLIFLCVWMIQQRKPIKEPSNSSISFSIMPLLQNHSVRKISLSMLFYCFSCFGFVTWVASCWNTTLNVAHETSNNYLAIMYLWEIVIVIVAGYILDKVNRRAFCAISFLIFSILVGIAFQLTHSSFIIPFIIIYPIFEGFVVTGLWTTVPQTVKNEKDVSFAIALFGTAQNIGMLLGPPIVGYVIDVGGWVAATILVSVSAILGMVETIGALKKKECLE